MIYETHLDTHEIKLLHESDDLPCMISVRFVPGNAVMVDDVFANAKVASAFLRDTLGMADAISVLDYWCISPNSDLWDLNHSRPYPKIVVQARDDEYFDEASKPSGEYSLLAQTGWSDYEGGGAYYLYERSDQTLWMGASVSPGCGNGDYDYELEPIAYSKWRQMVSDFDKQMEDFQGVS